MRCLTIILFSLALVSLAGCQHYATNAGDKPVAAIAAADESAAKITEPLIRAEVRRDTAAAAATHIVDLKAAPEPTLYAKAIAEAMGAQKTDLQEARAATSSTRENLAKAEDKARDQAKLNQDLRGKWYVIWGLRIEHAIGWLAAAAGVFLVGSILKDTALATGWGRVFVWAYKGILGVLSGGVYFVGLAGRAIVSRWFPVSSATSGAV